MAAATRHVFRMAAGLAGRSDEASAHMSALADGRILADVLLRLDRRFFGRAILVSHGPSTGMLRVAQLKRMFLRILAYGREVAGEDWSYLPTPNLDALARPPSRAAPPQEGPLFDSAVAISASDALLWDGFEPEAVEAMRLLCLDVIHAAVYVDGPLRSEAAAFLEALIHDQETRIIVESWIEDTRMAVLEKRAVPLHLVSSPPLLPVALSTGEPDAITKLETPAHFLRAIERTDCAIPHAQVDQKPPRLRFAHTLHVLSYDDSAPTNRCQLPVPNPVPTQNNVAAGECKTCGPAVAANGPAFPVASPAECGEGPWGVQDVAIETDNVALPGHSTRNVSLETGDLTARSSADALRAPFDFGPRLDWQSPADGLVAQLQMRCEETELALAVQTERERLLSESWSERESSLTDALASQMERAMNAEALLSYSEERATGLAADLSASRASMTSTLKELDLARSDRQELLERLAQTLASMEESSAALAHMQEILEASHLQIKSLEDRMSWSSQAYQSDVTELEEMIDEQAGRIKELESKAAASENADHVRAMLRDRLVKLRSAKTRLVAQRRTIAEARRDTEIACMHRRRLSKKLRKLWVRYYDLRHASERVDAENGTLQEQLLQARLDLARGEDGDAASQHPRIRELTATNAALSDRIAALESNEEKFASVSAAIVGELRSVVRNIQPDSTADGASRERAVALESELADARVAVDHLRSTLAERTALLGACEAEAGALKQRLHSAALELSALGAERSELLVKLGTAEQRASQSDGDLKAATEALEAVMRERDETITRMSEVAKAERKLHGLSESLKADLAQRAAQCIVLRDEAVLHRADAETRDAALTELEAQLAEIRVSDCTHAAHVLELEKRCKEGDGRVDQLTSQVCELEGRLRDTLSEKSSLHSESQHLESSLAEMSLEIASLVASKNDCERIIAELHAEAAGLRDDAESLGACLQQLPAADAQPSGQLDSVGADLQRIYRDISVGTHDDDERVAVLEARVSQLVEELQTASDLESDMQRHIAALDAARHAAESRAEMLDGQLSARQAPLLRNAAVEIESVPNDACFDTAGLVDITPSQKPGIDEACSVDRLNLSSRASRSCDEATLAGDSASEDMQMPRVCDAGPSGIDLRACVESIREEHRTILAVWHGLGARIYRDVLFAADREPGQRR